MKKLVLVIDKTLKKGEAANISGILSMAISKKVDLLGEDVAGKDGRIHSAITKYSLIVLKATSEELTTLQQQSDVAPGTTTVGFPRIAQEYNDNYLGYASKLRELDEVDYLGIAIFGEIQAVKQLTQHLSLYG